MASVTQTNGAASIEHTNSQRTITVTLTPTVDNLTAVQSSVRDQLNSLHLPDGVTTELGGVTTQQSDAFRQLGLALLAAIAIVYVVMVATFKSLIQPLILMISVPFAGTGALAALLATGTPLGVPALIGLLMLIGIVVTNAIVLIDLVNHYRRSGERVDEALINGARQRLRPILMTALATIFALVPMALGLTGGGLFISQPLAVMVIGGLVSSTVLTLLIVPVLYHLVEGRRESRRIRRDLAVATAGAPAVDLAAVEASATASPDASGRPGISGRPDASGGPETALAPAHAATSEVEPTAETNGHHPGHAAPATASEPVANGHLPAHVRPSSDTVTLPVSSVDGLATAAEGLARAFRGLAEHRPED